VLEAHLGGSGGDEKNKIAFGQNIQQPCRCPLTLLKKFLDYEHHHPSKNENKGGKARRSFEKKLTPTNIFHKLKKV
jgi:hypothetical protein